MWAKEGIECDAIDRKPAHLVFLVLTPGDDSQMQLEILSTNATSFCDPAAQHALVDADSVDRAWPVLDRLLLATVGCDQKTIAEQ